MRTPAIPDCRAASTPTRVVLAARLARRPAAFALPTAGGAALTVHLATGTGDVAILMTGFAAMLSAYLGLRTMRYARRAMGPIRILTGLRASLKAKSIADALERQWSASRIEIDAYGLRNWYGCERRDTIMHFPNGAKLQVNHGIDRTAIHFEIDRTGRGDLLSKVDSAFVADALLRIQMRVLATELHLPWDIGAHALSHAIGTMSTVETQIKRYDSSRDTGRPAVVVERRTIPKTGVVVTASRWEASDMHHELLVEGVRTGVLKLPSAAFSLVVRDDEAQSAAEALQITPKAVRTPLPAGRSRAERLTKVARAALERDPDLADASGTPIASLIERHLPRLVKTHRAADRTVRAQADESFERGLDVVARAVGESIDALASRSLDDLRTEVRFLESRHPERNPLLVPEESQA